MFITIVTTFDNTKFVIPSMCLNFLFAENMRQYSAKHEFIFESHMLVSNLELTGMSLLQAQWFRSSVLLLCASWSTLFG
jgi:hypothetical protein